MNISISRLVSGTFWTLGAFGLGTAIRLLSNIILARLLAPQLFGLMLIVNTLSIGVQLISDIGIGQNIIYSKNANDPRYYNTAWTLQVVRSAALWLVFMAISLPAARFYGDPVLAAVLPVSSVSIILGGFTAISPAMSQKRMEFARLNIFNLIVTSISTGIVILLARLDPTIWALAFGGVAGSAVSMIASYFLLPDIRHRFYIYKPYVWDIVGFGKWIFLNSIIYFLSNNFDRLYLAKVIPLALLGVYGIARNISDMLGAVAGRLGESVVFPFIASHQNVSRDDLRQQLVSIRLKFLLLAALGGSLFIATADLAIKLVYDERYHAASWMLPILVIGAWFSMLAAINESTLLGLGMPSYGAIANGVRLSFLVFGLPLSLKLKGLAGCIVTLGLVEVCRYVVILLGQKREFFSFAKQDLAITLTMFMLVGLWEWLRWVVGLGTSFDSFT